VVVVVPRGTAPDLQAAIEMRVSGNSLRPDPDYAKVHGLGTNDTLAVKAKAVTHDQLFSLSAARVPGRQPIALHRIDVPSGPGGRPYTAAELETMNKAGYEYDPATGQFAARPAQARAPLAGSAFGHLRGPNTTVGGALPSEALGEEVLRKLAGGEADILRAVGVEPPIGFDPRKNEWGLGQRQSDKAWVLVQGAPGEINWSQLPGIKPRGHSHPITHPITGKPRPMKGEGGVDWVTLDALKAGKHGDSLMNLAPSGSDLAVAAVDGKHLVATPYVYLGGGRIGTPKPGGAEPIVEFEIVSSRPDGLYHDTDLMLYRAEVRIRAGGETLYEGPMWGFQTPYYSQISFTRPPKVREVPKDFVVGEWAYRPGSAGGGGATTAAGSVHLQQRLVGIGLPPATDPDMASIMAKVDPATEAAFHHLLDLQAAGQVKGLQDWYQGLKLNPAPDRIDNMLAEIRQARRLADENPGAIIDLGADARAPLKHKKDASGRWVEDLGPGGAQQKDASFDIEVISPGGGVAWSSEIKTIGEEIKKPAQLSGTVKDAADKVKKRAANKPGLEIPGKKELRIEIKLFQGEEILAGDAKLVYDGAGKVTNTDLKGVARPGKTDRPNPANLWKDIEANLNKASSNAGNLDRITLVDPSGAPLARYNNVNGKFELEPPP
jgi:hypothetical protein